jgi:3-hydroxybutyryl-CoA dehydrogenase
MSGLKGLTALVLGTGAMGRGIARVLAGAGVVVRLLDVDAERTAIGVAALHAEAEADGSPVTVIAAQDLLSGLRGVGLVIEAVVENVVEKRELYAEVEATLLTTHGDRADEVVLASNTSSISIAELARDLTSPERFIGLHFFNPPMRMRLVEMVSGPATSVGTRTASRAWLEALGRTVVACADSPGFIVNRTCRPLYYEAQLLVQEGVNPAVVDEIARRVLGHRMGPLETLDLVGLHVHAAASAVVLSEFIDPRYALQQVVRRMVRAGSTGRAAGRGFYDYGLEPPREARAKVLRLPADDASSRYGGLTIMGPDHARVSASVGHIEHDVLDDLVGLDGVDAAGLVLFAAGPAASRGSVAAVHELASRGLEVIVESSDGTWVRHLPVGCSWVRIHAPLGECLVEAVDDAEAAIVARPSVHALADRIGAVLIAVPALAGLVADRLWACVINESLLVVEQGIATETDIDLALRLGMNHREGPGEHLAAVGPRRILAVLEQLTETTGDPRYRPCSLLRRRAGREVRSVGDR